MITDELKIIIREKIKKAETEQDATGGDTIHKCTTRAMLTGKIVAFNEILELNPKHITKEYIDIMGKVGDYIFNSENFDMDSIDKYRKVFMKVKDMEGE